MRSGVITLTLVCGGTAVADDGIHRKVDTADEQAALELDPTLRFAPVEGLATYTTDDHATSFALGPRARSSVEGRTWGDGILAYGEAPNVRNGGWTAAARYDVELLWGVHLEVDASLMRLAPQMNGMFGTGMVAGYGAALTRYFTWSGGRVAWISLGVEHTELVGDHSVAVPHGTTVGLRIGTTF